MRQLLDAPELAAKLGANGYRRAQDFGWDRIIDQLELVYEALLTSPRKDRALVSV